MKIPKKYQHLPFDKKGFLRDENAEKVVANPRTAGKPKYIKLAGNTFSSGYATPFLRAKVVREIKAFYAQFLGTVEQLSLFPLRIEWDLYTTVDVPNFDLSNLWFYYKYFEDTLVQLGIIPDDSIQYVTHPPAPRLFPVDTEDERKFVFRIYHDDRPALKRHPLWDTQIPTRQP